MFLDHFHLSKERSYPIWSKNSLANPILLFHQMIQKTFLQMPKEIWRIDVTMTKNALKTFLFRTIWDPNLNTCPVGMITLEIWKMHIGKGHSNVLHILWKVELAFVPIPCKPIVSLTDKFQIYYHLCHITNHQVSKFIPILVFNQKPRYVLIHIE